MKAHSRLPLPQRGIIGHPVLLQARDRTFPELLAHHTVEKHLWIVDICQTNSLRCVAIVGQLREGCRRLHEVLSVFELHWDTNELLTLSLRSERRL